MKRAGDCLFLLVFGLLILAPGAAVIAQFVPLAILDDLRTSALFGQTVRAAPPDFQTSSVFSTQTQAAIGSWLNERMGRPREFYIRLNNSVDYLLGRSSNRSIVVGKRGELFTTEMLADLCSRRDEGKPVDDIARGLRRAQDIITRLGKAFVVVLSPNKAAVQPENIPDYCAGASPTRLYPRFISALEDTGVKFVDSEALARESARDGMPNWFGKYGQHWNAIGVFYATRAILGLLHEQIPGNFGSLKIEGMTIDDIPRGVEADTGLLSNFVFPLNAVSPHLEMKVEGARDKLRPLIVGTSFSGGFVEGFLSSGLADKVILYDYFHSMFQYESVTRPRIPIEGEVTEHYRSVLKEIDAVIVEVNAPALRSSHIARFVAATEMLH